MLLATTVVAVVPLAVSLALRAFRVISSGWLSVALAVALSVVASWVGNAYWRKRGAASEVLFGELLLWGWLRRWRQERELANATRLLDLASLRRTESSAPPSGSHQDALPVERREHLLRQLAGALEGQDVYLNGHSRRVARHATMIARGMGLPSEEVARVRAAAAVHDVGKLLTPKVVLNKPARLTDAEFAVIQRHPVDGSEMVAALGDPELTRIVRHHHERLDGAGYPDRLTGEAIPLGARIIAVADTFDAITSARPYRAPAPHQKAIDILRQEAGTQLDPDAVRAFLAYYSGNRPTVVWAVITSFLRRMVAWLSGDPAAAATLSASKLAAATAATAAIGAAAATTPVPAVHHSAHPVTAAHSVPSAIRGRALTVGSTGAPGATTVVHVTPASGAAGHGVRSRGAHGLAAHKAPPRHRANHGAANHGAASNSAPGKAGHRSATSPGGQPAGGTAGGSTTSAAGGASSRPTSLNPAGHVNHASSTGASARSGQLPHPTAPGHSSAGRRTGNASGQGHASTGQSAGSTHATVQSSASSHASSPPAPSQGTAGPTANPGNSAAAGSNVPASTAPASGQGTAASAGRTSDSSRVSAGQGGNDGTAAGPSDSSPAGGSGHGGGQGGS